MNTLRFDYRSNSNAEKYFADSGVPGKEFRLYPVAGLFPALVVTTSKLEVFWDWSGRNEREAVE